MARIPVVCAVSAAASWCERAAKRSISARVISSSLPTSEASLIICLPVKGLVRPSWVIASTALTSPIRKPNRAPGSRYGAFDIDSCPPATMHSASPVRSSVRAALAAFSALGPEAVAAVDAFDQAASLPVDPGAMIALAAGTVPLAYAAPLFAFEAALHEAPWEFYLRLRRRNAAPFAAYFDCPEVEILSASPERFLRVDVDGRPAVRVRVYHPDPDDPPSQGLPGVVSYESPFRTGSGSTAGGSFVAMKWSGGQGGGHIGRQGTGGRTRAAGRHGQAGRHGRQHGGQGRLIELHDQLARRGDASPQVPDVVGDGECQRLREIAAGAVVGEDLVPARAFDCGSERPRAHHLHLEGAVVVLGALLETDDRLAHVPHLGGQGGQRLGGLLRQRCIVMFGNQKTSHFLFAPIAIDYNTPASFLSLAISSSTEATFTPAPRLAGSMARPKMGAGNSSGPASPAANTRGALVRRW